MGRVNCREAAIRYLDEIAELLAEVAGTIEGLRQAIKEDVSCRACVVHRSKSKNDGVPRSRTPMGGLPTAGGASEEVGGAMGVDREAEGDRRGLLGEGDEGERLHEQTVDRASGREWREGDSSDARLLAWANQQRGLAGDEQGARVEAGATKCGGDIPSEENVQAAIEWLEGGCR